VQTTILSTLEVHSARPATGRIATDVSAHATALPIANSSPKRHLTWNNALISDIRSQTSEGAQPKYGMLAPACLISDF
jgi:hypothetical protein